MPGPFGGTDSSSVMAQLLGNPQLMQQFNQAQMPTQTPQSMMTTPPPNQIMANQAQQMGQAPMTTPGVNPTGMA